MGIHAGYAIYFPELFPGALRATGCGFCFNGGRLVAASILVLAGQVKASGLDLRVAVSLLGLLFLLGLVVAGVPARDQGPTAAGVEVDDCRQAPNRESDRSAGQQTHHGQPVSAAARVPHLGRRLDDDAQLDRRPSQRARRARRTHGAILFRGFPLVSAEDFDRFVTAFELPNFPYDESLSNAVRMNRTPRVFTANEAPPDVTIYLHHEMAQTPIYPSRLFFFCEHAADNGGATPICRSDVLWEQLEARSPRFARDCAAKGLRLLERHAVASDPTSGMGRSWQSTLAAGSPAEAERRLGLAGLPLAMARRRLPAGDDAGAAGGARIA